MSSSKADLITHPIRARILGALMGRQLTIGQIAQVLPDVPIPSLYRHVRTLTEGGVLEAVSEVRVNGALTKVYATRKEQTIIGEPDMVNATAADHLRAMTTFLNTLAEIFRNYLEQETLVPGDTPHHALMTALHLSKAEYAQFNNELHELVRRWCDREPGGERHRLIFANLILPDREDPPLS
jgi:DNA-binding transcriptional ArsR family regulator